MRAAREADLFPYFRTVESPAMPVVEMEGAPRIMLASNNYLGLTGDERVMGGAEDALHRYGTGLTGSRLLNGTTPLHLELERELAEWMGTDDALVFTTGHQANVGTLGTLLSPGDTVIVDSADHASILDGALLSKAKLRPFRHGRLEKLERALERARAGRRRHPGCDRRRLLDGGRHRAAGGHRGALQAPWRTTDGGRGARRGRAGRARSGRLRAAGRRGAVDLRMGTFSKSLASCGGFVAGPAEVIDYLRISSRAFLFTASAVPAALGAALAALRIIRSQEGPPLLAAVLENAQHLAEGLQELGIAPCRGSRSVPPGGPDAPMQSFTTPIVPVLVGDDWKAALLWRALYDGGVFTNCALHPAVPPGGALLRTSVMATHDRDTLDRALEVFARVKRSSRLEHGPLPAP